MEMQHRSPVHYSLDHEGQLLCMVVLAVCVRALWVIHTPCVRPLLHWTEVYPRVPGFIPVQWNNRRQKQACPPSGTLAEKFDWVVEEWPNYNQELVYCYKDGTRAKEDLCRFLDPGREVKISPGLIVFFSV